MRRWDDGWLHSLQDLIAVLECEHRLHLEHLVAAGVAARPPAGVSATLELVAEHGDAHERSALAQLRRVAQGEVVEISRPGRARENIERAAQQTLEALADQVDVVYQGALLVDGFYGYADFLVSIDPSTGRPLVDQATGRRRYEPVDAKLARSARPAALLQAGCYADALVRLGQPMPSKVHVWLGSDRIESVAAADVLPLVREYRERVLARLRTEPVAPVPGWGDARPACATCSWTVRCEEGRRSAQDLSLVARIRRDQVHRLHREGRSSCSRATGSTSRCRTPCGRPTSCTPPSCGGPRRPRRQGWSRSARSWGCCSTDGAGLLHEVSWLLGLHGSMMPDRCTPPRPAARTDRGVWAVMPAQGESSPSLRWASASTSRHIF